MEITKTNESTNVEAKVKIGSVDYTFNYAIKDSKITTLNGSASIEGSNKGTFNVYSNVGIDSAINSNTGFNFSSSIDLATRLLIVGDVDSIVKELGI